MELKERIKRPPLKEQLASHYRQKDFTVSKAAVQSSVSTAGIVVYWAMTFFLLYESLFIIVPDLYKGEYDKQLLMKILIGLTFFVCTLNWFAIKQGFGNGVRPSDKTKYFEDCLQQMTPSGWRNCPKCQLDAPPRSHHCNLCGKCVLKRDHHCFITGSCVGFYNQRFFVFFCLYMVWANALAAYLQISYLNKSVPIFSSSTINFLFPVALFNFITGTLSFMTLVVVLSVYICLVLAGLGLFFFSWHVLLSAQGITSHEAWKKIRPYGNNNILTNLRSVFGPLKYLPLTLLFPFRVDQIGDGIYWEPRRKSVKGN
ncbi:hypothetical protein ScPMuIL_014209 [Solemya velum]